MKHKDTITTEIIQELNELAPELNGHFTEDQMVPETYFDDLEERTIALMHISEASHNDSVPIDYFAHLENVVIGQMTETKKFMLFRSAYLRVAALILVTFCGALLIKSSLSTNTSEPAQNQGNLTEFVNELDQEEIAYLLDEYDTKEDIQLLEQANLLDIDLITNGTSSDYYDLDASSDATLEEYMDQHIELF